MVTTLCLVTCALSLGQPNGQAGWQLAPQLFQGLELTYSGTYREEVLIPGVQFQRSYRLDTTVFVLDQAADHWDVAFLTALSLRSNRREPEPAATKAAAPASVRLEIAQVDRRGRLKGRQGTVLAIPVDGPPTVETGAILQFPLSGVARNQLWETSEAGRPAASWQVLGSEFCNGTTCVKITGQQQSADWDEPRGDRTAWRRRDTLWVAPQLGVAYRVERVIERREPNRRDPTHRLEVRYELDSRLRYPGKLFDDRQQEIVKAVKFRADAARPLAEPAAYRPQIEVLRKKIAYHLENSAATPYRKAIVQIQSQLERAARGELPSESVVEEKAVLIPVLRIGQRAPDFVCTDLIGKESSVRLYRALGRPVLLVFYNPATPNGKLVLEFSKALTEKNSGKVSILALAVTSDAALVRRQHADLKLPFTILDGQGLHTTFAVEATPRMVLLDAEGVVRGAFTGWGIHTPGEIETELRRWLPRKE